MAKELQREREHSSYLVEELKGALSSPRPMPVMPAALMPKGLPPALARRMSSVAGVQLAGSCSAPVLDGGRPAPACPWDRAGLLLRC